MPPSFTFICCFTYLPTIQPAAAWPMRYIERSSAGRKVSRAGRWRRLAAVFQRLGKEMIARGVELHEALPVGLFRRRMARLDLRNHRKVAVIDGRSATPARRTSSMRATAIKTWPGTT